MFLIALLQKWFPMHKTLSLDGSFWFIPEIVNAKISGRSTHGCGWVHALSGDFYPFAFHDIRKGETVKATPEEVQQYKQLVGWPPRSKI